MSQIAHLHKTPSIARIVSVSFNHILISALIDNVDKIPFEISSANYLHFAVAKVGVFVFVHNEFLEVL